MTRRPKSCKRCNKPATQRRTISKRGLCRACAIEAVTANNVSMASKAGPVFEAAQAASRAGLVAYARRIASEG